MPFKKLGKFTQFLSGALQGMSAACLPAIVIVNMEKATCVYAIPGNRIKRSVRLEQASEAEYFDNQTNISIL